MCFFFSHVIKYVLNLAFKIIAMNQMTIILEIYLCTVKGVDENGTNSEQYFIEVHKIVVALSRLHQRA